MCGDAKFVKDFMLLADKMGMTDPNEYVYLEAIQNADSSQLKLSRTSRTVRAFKPVLKVS